MSPRTPRYRGLPLVVIALVVLDAAALRPSSPAPGESLTSPERLGWDQQAGSTAILRTLQYAIYVDGARSVLRGVICDPAPGAEGYECSAPLPPMAPGAHVLELASFVISAGAVRESLRSPPLHVTVPAASAAPIGGVAGASPEPITTVDGVRIVLETVVDGLTQPVDFAQAGDGRFFIAERAGRVIIAGPPRGRGEVALTLDDFGTHREAELLALALHPAFDRTRFVFLVYTVPGRPGERVFEVARFREVSGRLAERATLLDGVPASPVAAAASVRFGPDGRLYVSFDDAGAPVSAGSLGSFNGKVLRLTDTGALPDDNPLPSIVYSLGHRSPRGFDWHPATRALWVVDRDVGGRGALMRVSPGMPADSSARWQASPDFLPRAAGAAFYAGDEVPEWYGDLFLAAGEGAHLVRVHFDDREPTTPLSVERLPVGRDTHIRQVVMGADGALYFGTANPSATEAGGDVLVRLVADRARRGAAQ